MVSLIHSIFNYHEGKVYLDELKEVTIKGECPVCYEQKYLEKLDCDHRICGICRAKIRDTSDGWVKCPLCRRSTPEYNLSFTSTISFKLIFYIKKMHTDWIQIYRALWKTIQSEIACIFELDIEYDVGNEVSERKECSICKSVHTGELDCGHHICLICAEIQKGTYHYEKDRHIRCHLCGENSNDGPFFNMFFMKPSEKLIVYINSVIMRNEDE